MEVIFDGDDEKHYKIVNGKRVEILEWEDY